MAICRIKGQTLIRYLFLVLLRSRLDCLILKKEQPGVFFNSNIFFLCCGNGNTKTNDSLDQENFLKLLNYCRQEFDYILVDCPPVLSSNDALSIAPAADLTFLIIRSGEVQRPVAEKAKTLLQNDECQIGGIILNRVQQVIPSWVYKFI